MSPHLKYLPVALDGKFVLPVGGHNDTAFNDRHIRLIQEAFHEICHLIDKIFYHIIIIHKISLHFFIELLLDYRAQESTVDRLGEGVRIPHLRQIDIAEIDRHTVFQLALIH